MNHSKQVAPVALLSLAAVWPTIGYAADPVLKVHTQLTPSCPSPNLFEYDASAGKCAPKAAAIKGLKKEECVASTSLVLNEKGECIAPEHLAPSPTCPAGATKTSFNKQLRACVEERPAPVSSLADYEGDCFEIRSTMTGQLTELEPRSLYLVASQTPSGDKDKKLRLSKATTKWWMLGCKANAEKNKQVEVLASELVASGAHRMGWAYGALALPYKFYPDSKSFGSGVAIGPYVGRRWGSPGQAYTFAVAATIGSVKGEVRSETDPNSIVSTPDLQALSVAAGWMWDIAKDPAVRPFKLGLFFGADYVGSDKRVTFRNHGKPWVALQIGFEFTDN